MKERHKHLPDQCTGYCGIIYLLPDKPPSPTTHIPPTHTKGGRERDSEFFSERERDREQEKKINESVRMCMCMWMWVLCVRACVRAHTPKCTPEVPA